MMLKQLFDQQQAQFALEPLFGQLDQEELFPQSLLWIFVVLFLLLLMLLLLLPAPQKNQNNKTVNTAQVQPALTQPLKTSKPSQTPACQTAVVEKKPPTADELICNALLTAFESNLWRWSASINCQTLTLRFQNPQTFFF